MTSIAHQEAARRNGKLYGGTKPRTPEQIREFFDSHLDKSGNCWLWTGSINTYGYGTIAVNGKNKMVHRYAYEILKGEIQEGLFVCHKCDVRNCVNPEHLFLGTANDNNQDMISKGRQVLNGPKPNITQEQIEFVRKNYIPWKRTVKMLAEELGIGHHSVKWAIFGSYKK
jgi:hypothetical protein